MSLLRNLLNSTSTKYNFLPSTSPFANININLPEYATYPLLTARKLRKHTKTPKRIRLLARDYIDDALYNPNYGYFSSRVEIVGTSDLEHGFTFSNFANSNAFDDAVAQRYQQFVKTDNIDKSNDNLPDHPANYDSNTRSVWHTPTELFKPWYARAIAKCLATNYRLTLFPYADLTIYELGGGNGTMMRGILDYLAEEDEQVYERVRYHIVEVSPRLANLQRKRAGPHANRVQIHNHDALDWSQHEFHESVIAQTPPGEQPKIKEPVYVLAFELLDNLAHDVVRYDVRTGEPYQGVITIDPEGDFHEAFTKVTDPLIKRFLDIRSLYSQAPYPKFANIPAIRNLLASLPFASNLSPREFIPTRSLKLVETLEKVFTSYKPIFADFDKLPDTTPGYQAPVVQTRVQGQTVPCHAYLVAMGHFDIFFPTDFNLLGQLIHHVKYHSKSNYSSASSQTLPSSSSSSSAPIPPQTSQSSSSRLFSLRNSSYFPFSNINEAQQDPYKFFGDAFLPKPKNVNSSSSSSSIPFFTSRRLSVGYSNDSSSHYNDGEDRLHTSRSSVADSNTYSNNTQTMSQNSLRVMTHRDFLLEFGDIHQTTLKDKSNPMLEMYGNQKIIF